MATQEDRSLSSGVSFPKWMKTRMTDKFDLNQSAFSPTELDDSFMLYYSHNLRKTDSNVISSNLTESNSITTAPKEPAVTKPDFSKHTPPCQRFLQNNDIALTQPMTPAPPSMKIKSNGTDDGFKGEAAKCGSSVIRVAHQMVAGKVIHGFTIKKDDDCEPNLDQFDPHRRRGSRSLPASPISSPNTSPKGKRRTVNKYFTGAFVDTDKNKGGWILSNLLTRRDLSQSVGYIGEESKEDMERSMSTMSVDEVGAAASGANKSNKNPVYKAKPSELREMNFWSPTSM